MSWSSKQYLSLMLPFPRPAALHPPNDLCDSKRRSTNRQQQLNVYRFYILLHVSTLVRSQHQAIKNAELIQKKFPLKPELLEKLF